MPPRDPEGAPAGELPAAHLGDDELVLLALGERVPGAEEHLAACARCRAELARSAAVVSTARSSPELPGVPVPAGTWEAVARETGVSASPGAPAVAAPAAGPVAGPGARQPAAVGAAGVPVRPAAAPRAGARRWLALAAAFVVGAGAGAVGSRLGEPGGTPVAAPSSAPSTAPSTAPTGPGAPPGAAVLASGALEPLDGGPASGAVTVAAVDGHRRLEVDVRDVSAPGDGVLEVWLLDADGGLLSLGTLTGERLQVALPESVDLARFAVVDVSREPLDGDPGHSSDSVLRGELGLGA
ncbi:anti-sigma factor [Kineococcus gypseus]|uniref:anti-sigma factor n=1 Tax=Kineococcus gypseus TaxID=1637102 RepID=UPI003D7E32C1